MLVTRGLGNVEFGHLPVVGFGPSPVEVVVPTPVPDAIGVGGGHVIRSRIPKRIVGDKKDIDDLISVLLMIYKKYYNE